MSVPSQRPILLLGSIPLQGAESVFRVLADTVGSRAKRYPDGETGERGYWIRWQRRTFDAHPQFELVEARRKLKGYRDEVERPFFRLREESKKQDVGFASLGYADSATSSYAIFRRLKGAGVIPGGTRFQVCLPTAVALASGFVVLEDRASVEPALEEAFKNEVTRIAAAVPPAELAIQWDIVFEIIGFDGGHELHYGDILHGSAARIARYVESVPAGAECGLHFCYGDPGHKHIIEPKDTGSAVKLANAIFAKSARPVQWIHLPVPRERGDEAYFVPLRALKLPSETELYLGLIHLTDGLIGTRQRMAVAEKFTAAFGVATECGFGRRAPATIPNLLSLHSEVAGSP